MVLPHLPNEILLRIAACFVEPNEILLRYPSACDYDYEMLWVLCGVCRLFRNFARKMIFDEVCISMHPELLHKDANILSLAHIARNVKTLRLYNYDEDDERDIFTETTPPKYLVNDRDSIGYALYTDVINVSCWAAETSLHLTRILFACSSQLKSIKIVDKSKSIHRSYTFYSTIARILSVYSFPCLDTLVIAANLVGLPSPFWEPSLYSPVCAKILNKNLMQVSNIEYQGGCASRRSDLGSKDLRGFETWLSSLPLFELAISYIMPKENRYCQLHLSPLCKLQDLRSLSFVHVQAYDSFTSLLRSFHALQSLRLWRCIIPRSSDRWAHVFASCLELPLLSIEMHNLAYDDGPNRRETCCQHPTLCSAYESDETAFKYMLQHLKARGAVFKGSEWSNVCTDHSEDEIRQYVNLVGDIARETRPAPPEFDDSYRAFVENGKLIEAVGDLLDTERGQGQSDYTAAFTEACLGRRFGVTKDNYMWLLPPVTEKGDLACLIAGAPTPYLLRQITPGIIFSTL